MWSREEGDDFDLIWASGDTLEVANEGLRTLASALWGGPVAALFKALTYAEEIIIENATCDEEVNRKRLVEFIVPLRSGDYDAYVLFASRVQQETKAGYSWTYADFYDRGGANCGGARDGIKIEFIEGGMYSPPDEYFEFGS